MPGVSTAKIAKQITRIHHDKEGYQGKVFFFFYKFSVAFRYMVMLFYSSSLLRSS